MGIYLPNMEMPNKKNGAVLIIYPDGKCAFEDGKTYQAVSVPPHGDLIDREWTLKQIRPWSPEDEYAACTFDTVKKLMHTLLNDSPTIIAAEPPKEKA